MRRYKIQHAELLKPKKVKLIDRQTVRKWLEKKIIRPSCSDFVSGVVLAKKKGGVMRLCVNYRNINRNIIQNRYPLLVMKDQLDSLSELKVKIN